MRVVSQFEFPQRMESRRSDSEPKGKKQTFRRWQGGAESGPVAFWPCPRKRGAFPSRPAPVAYGRGPSASSAPSRRSVFSEEQHDSTADERRKSDDHEYNRRDSFVALNAPPLIEPTTAPMRPTPFANWIIRDGLRLTLTAQCRSVERGRIKLWLLCGLLRHKAAVASARPTGSPHSSRASDL